MRRNGSRQLPAQGCEPARARRRRAQTDLKLAELLDERVLQRAELGARVAGEVADDLARARDGGRELLAVGRPVDVGVRERQSVARFFEQRAAAKRREGAGRT